MFHCCDTFGYPENFRTEEIVFDIADTPLPYNGILGRPALVKFMAVSHFAYNMMKIPAAWGVIKVKADINDAIFYVQKLNQTVAMTADTRQEVQDVGADAFSGDGGYPGARRRLPPRKRHSTATRDDQEGSTNKRWFPHHHHRCPPL